MIKGKQDEFDEIVCEENEYGSDADFDTYAVQVMNGDGYYDETGKFRRYATPED